MAGIKGRSGRKSASDAQKRQRIIEKAWDYVEQVLDDPKVPLEIKVDIAKSIIVKDIPQRVEGKSELKVTVQHEDIEERLSWFQTQSVN